MCSYSGDRHLHEVQTCAFVCIKDEACVECLQLDDRLAHAQEHSRRKSDTGFQTQCAEACRVFLTQVLIALIAHDVAERLMHLADVAFDVRFQLIDRQILDLGKRLDDIEVLVNSVGDTGVDRHIFVGMCL